MWPFLSALHTKLVEPGGNSSAVTRRVNSFWQALRIFQLCLRLGMFRGLHRRPASWITNKTSIIFRVTMRTARAVLDVCSAQHVASWPHAFVQAGRLGPCCKTTITSAGKAREWHRCSTQEMRAGQAGRDALSLL